MLTVTDKAKEELRRIVDEGRIDPGKFLRLTTPPVWTGQGDFGIVIDEERHMDQSFKCRELKVLLVDPELAKELPNSVLDFKDFPEGSRFTLDVF